MVFPDTFQIPKIPIKYWRNLPDIRQICLTPDPDLWVGLLRRAKAAGVEVEIPEGDHHLLNLLRSRLQEAQQRLSQENVAQDLES